ncbi:MAG: TetR/AcrR family transcriptional regulator [Gemmatimonadota bacterium]|nr:TetR/AcrR family transcriptional regulator [Gemmatimonadota bacterium]
MSEPGTKQSILDTAERLFANTGFHNTSLRAITSQAGVNLAAVNYHFGSKEDLAGAIFKRRLLPINQARLEQLESVRRAAALDGREPSVEEILRAFIEPTLTHFDKIRDSGLNFICLVGRLHAEPDGALREIFIGMMKPTFIQFFEALCQVLPDIPKDVVFHRMMFAVGAMGKAFWHAANPEHLPKDFLTINDKDTLIDMLIPFITAGMEAPWRTSGR